MLVLSATVRTGCCIAAKAWTKVVPTFAVEEGTLKRTQTRDQNATARGRGNCGLPGGRQDQAEALSAAIR